MSIDCMRCGKAIDAVALRNLGLKRETRDWLGLP